MWAPAACCQQPLQTFLKFQNKTDRDNRRYRTLRAVTHASLGHEADARSQCLRRSCMLAPVLLAVMASAGKALAADSIPAKAEDKLIADLLARSAANKERYNKERLASYYKRNYKDYFSYQRGAMESGQMKSLSKGLQQEILEWLKKND